MTSRARVRRAVSAGGVVWRRGPSGPEIVLCGRTSDRLWALPKGTPDEGEGLEAAALREVREETGLAAKTTAPLPSIDYWFAADGIRYHKFVHHWLMEPIGGSIDEHDREFDVVEWVPIGEAKRILSYVNERRVVEEAEHVIEGMS